MKNYWKTIEIVKLKQVFKVFSLNFTWSWVISVSEWLTTDYMTCDVSQLWRHQAIKKVKYTRLWGIHSCFHWCKNYKNRPRNARVIVENKVAPFLSEHGVYSVEWNVKPCTVTQSLLLGNKLYNSCFYSNIAKKILHWWCCHLITRWCGSVLSCCHHVHYFCYQSQMRRKMWFSALLICQRSVFVHHYHAWHAPHVVLHHSSA